MNQSINRVRMIFALCYLV